MDTSDDPGTTMGLLLLMGGAAAGGMAAAGAFSGKDGGGGGMPSMEAANISKTAQPEKQLSEQAKKNKRLKASLLTRDWGEPRLGKAGLLGLGGQGLP